jgi:hypothetical protein
MVVFSRYQILLLFKISKGLHRILQPHQISTYRQIKLRELDFVMLMNKGQKVHTKDMNEGEN